MNIKFISTVFLILTSLTLGQTTSPYPLVTLQDINAIGDTATAWWPSPLAGDTVRVQGSVICRPLIDPVNNRRPVLYYAAALGNYIQSADRSPWGGLNIYEADSGAATGFDFCDTAAIYEFTGWIQQYGAITELNLITEPAPIPVKLISHQSKRPDPIQLTLDSCFNNYGFFNIKLRKYAGMYVEFKSDHTHPLITSGLIPGPGSTEGGFTIMDTLGRSINMYAQSVYFRTNPRVPPVSYNPPPNGTRLSYIRGILQAAYQPTAGWIWEIIPLYPGDLGAPVMSPPAFSGCTRDPGIVPLNTPVQVKTICDGLVGAKVTSVVLFSIVNGINNPSTVMTKGTGADSSTYTGTIPAVTNGDSSFVEYYCQATDNNNLTATIPYDISRNRFSYFVFADTNKKLTIQHIRYSPLGSGYSSYNGYPVTVTGVVTADTSDIPGSNANNAPRVFIQNGEGPWSGIKLGYKGPFGLNTFNLKRGDIVTVTGSPALSPVYGARLDTLTQLTVISHNNPLPAPHIMKTGDVGVAALGDLNAEPWNGCIVTYNSVTIDSANADGPNINYGESYAHDAALGTHTRITWSDGRTRFYNGPTGVLVKKGDKFTSITGILGYTHYNYKLCPRKDDDLVGYISGVKNEMITLPTKYVLNQNYPNPFNPTTTITYSLPIAGNVKLIVYNALGAKVATIVNEYKPAGNYTVHFNASNLPSGIYLYRLESGDYNSAKKFVLLK